MNSTRWQTLDLIQKGCFDQVTTGRHSLLSRHKFLGSLEMKRKFCRIINDCFKKGCRQKPDLSEGHSVLQTIYQWKSMKKQWLEQSVLRWRHLSRSHYQCLCRSPQGGSRIPWPEPECPFLQANPQMSQGISGSAPSAEPCRENKTSFIMCKNRRAEI